MIITRKKANVIVLIENSFTVCLVMHVIVCFFMSFDFMDVVILVKNKVFL